MVAGMDDSVSLAKPVARARLTVCAEDSLLRFDAGHPLWMKDGLMGGGVVLAGSSIYDDGLLEWGCLRDGIALQGGMPLEGGRVPGVGGGEGAAAEAADHVDEEGDLREGEEE